MRLKSSGRVTVEEENILLVPNANINYRYIFSISMESNIATLISIAYLKIKSNWI